MGESAIRCVGLSRYFGDVRALTDLNLSIPYGSIFGFLGRNGAGKTTAIRLLTGLISPSAGSAWVAGDEVTQEDGHARRNFGYLPQDPVFYKWMTPVEYLDYSARLFQMEPAERKRRVPEILEMFGLKETARRKIGGFSGGMHQRLGIAQAMIHQPSVLFLDEPTSALDPAGRHELLDLIAGLRGKVTVFFSTHILSDVERVCDRVAIIHKGQLVLESERSALLERYAANRVEIAVDASSVNGIEEFGRSVGAQPWAASVHCDQNIVRIEVTNIDQGKQSLLPLMAAHQLVVNRYEWTRPTLEEIFLQISE